MNTYEKSLNVLEELFAKDYQFALATSSDNIPSVRFVDTFYDDSAFILLLMQNHKKYKRLKKIQKFQCAINFIVLVGLPIILDIHYV